MDADEAIERALALATTLGGDGGGDDVDMRLVGQLLAVSYTHLTLPTICSV